MSTNHQREGVTSNAHAGKDFEDQIYDYFTSEGISIEKDYSIPVGVSSKKAHRFDFGNDSLLIECKSHKWTASDGIPQGKIHVWNEAMFYFYMAPTSFKKYFVVLMDFSQKRWKTLVQYYIERYQNFIPKDVVIYEYYEQSKYCEIYKFDEELCQHIIER
ncbi:MAG: hypothetical protein PQJ61_04620 [Spirochaetales bacterium]|uniref:Endonuclease n=1 Tax=Candidatus Thalassospirochaeta sargassi TaxID=3119039 RepID=A0AAJ1IES3_9SPIO|nr:hypothetical protein [Spirochaetales bacterium]